jgi:hypothetical protein
VTSSEWVQCGALLGLATISHALHPTDTGRLGEIITTLGTHCRAVTEGGANEWVRFAGGVGLGVVGCALFGQSGATSTAEDDSTSGTDTCFPLYFFSIVGWCCLNWSLELPQKAVESLRAEDARRKLLYDVLGILLETVYAEFPTLPLKDVYQNSGSGLKPSTLDLF